MAREYTRDATEHGQIMIADAIRKLSGSSDDSVELREFNRDATEYGQNVIVEAIRGLANVISVGGSSSTSQSPEIRVNVTQSEHQLIYWNFSYHDEFGMINSDIDTSDPTQYSQQYGNLVSSVVKCGQIFEIGILPDNGYNRGDFVIRIDDKLLVEGQDYYVSGNEVHSLGVPLGSTLNISATSATPV